MKNKGVEGKAYTVKGVLAAHTVLYTGELKHSVKKERFQEKIPEGEGKYLIYFWYLFTSP